MARKRRFDRKKIERNPDERCFGPPGTKRWIDRTIEILRNNEVGGLASMDFNGMIRVRIHANNKWRRNNTRRFWTHYRARMWLEKRDQADVPVLRLRGRYGKQP